MLHLHRGGPDGKEFYMNIIGDNGEQLWRTSETYKRRAGAFKAAYAGAKEFGKGCRWNGQFTDHSQRGKPVVKFVDKETLNMILPK